MPASARRPCLRGWSGSRHCGPRRSAGWWPAATCSSRSSTSRTWRDRRARTVSRRAPGGLPQSTAGRRAGPQAAGPARGHGTGARRGRGGHPARSSGRSGARAGPPCGPTGRCAATRPASTSTPSAPATASPGSATRDASPKRPRSTASTSSAPTCPPIRSRPKRRSAPYKGLSRVERDYRSYKTVDLKVCPVHHRLEGRVRAHIFLGMLAYYVEWHMHRSLAPLLFDDGDPAAAGATRPSPAEPARAKGGPHAHPGRPSHPAPSRSLPAPRRPSMTCTLGRTPQLSIPARHMIPYPPDPTRRPIDLADPCPYQALATTTTTVCWLARLRFLPATYPPDAAWREHRV